MSAIDRAAFMDALHEIEDADGLFDEDDLYQAVLALVHRAVGVLLSPDEAQLALAAIEDQIVGVSDRPTLRALAALGNRLDPDFPAPEDDDEDDKDVPE